MKLWTSIPDLTTLNRMMADTLVSHLGITITEVGDDFLRATLPVDARTRQPFGLLHGGASVALAESLGSIASSLCVDLASEAIVGVEINANHLRAVRSGTVTGTVRPLHRGRTMHVWDIRIENEAGEAVCVSRLTVAVRPRVDRLPDALAARG